MGLGSGYHVVGCHGGVDGVLRGQVSLLLAWRLMDGREGGEELEKAVANVVLCH